MSIARDWDYAVKTMLESLEDDRLHQQRLLDGDMDSIHAAWPELTKRPGFDSFRTDHEQGGRICPPEPILGVPPPFWCQRP